MRKQLTIIVLFLLVSFAATLFLWQLATSIPIEETSGIPSFYKVAKLQRIVSLSGE